MVIGTTLFPHKAIWRPPDATTKKGLRQGDSLACLLFNIALEKGKECRNTDEWNCILQICPTLGICG